MNRAGKVVWLEEPGRLVLRPEEVAAPAEGQVRCATLVSAISPGTELAAYNGLPPLRDAVVYPRLQGYCNVARIEEVGKGIEGFAVGDRILSFTSHRSDFLIDQGDVLLKLAPEMDADRVVTSYLFHLGYSAILRGNVRAGHRVLVVGLGALGLTTVGLAARAGARVTGVTAHPAAAQKAHAMGAEAVVSRDEVADAEADVVISTVNNWSDWTLALRAAAAFGTIVVLGFPGRGESAPQRNPLDSRFFYTKQLSLVAAGLCPSLPDPQGFLRFNERENLAWLASEIQLGRLDASAIVSGRYPGEAIDQAYRDLNARKGDPVTYLLDWNA